MSAGPDRTLLPRLLMLLLLLPVPGTAEPVSVEDFAGRTVTLAAPARRVVALAPHIVENVFSAGAGDRLVGVVSYSNYPGAARTIPRVGSYNAFSLETIASLQPDLIVMWGSGNGMQSLARLELLGIPVFVSEPRQLEDIPRAIRDLGTLAGTRQVSETRALEIEQALASLRAKYSQRATLTVFYEIWNEPLQTINGEHLISQLMALCGGRNIFADVATLAPRISIEAVLARAPDAIVASGMGESRPEWLDQWRQYPSLPAVRNNALFFVPPDHLQRPTARVLLGAQALCEQLDSARQ
jgi:iron complex transport system substrate-binding protein